MKLKDAVRRQILSQVKKIVVKIGTGVLTTDDGYLDKEQIKNLGIEIVLVGNSEKTRYAASVAGSCSSRAK